MQRMFGCSVKALVMQALATKKSSQADLDVIENLLESRCGVVESAQEKYSIAEARTHLPTIVDEAKAGLEIELTRRGKAVAVIVSQQLERLRSERSRFGDVSNTHHNCGRFTFGDEGLCRNFFTFLGELLHDHMEHFTDILQGFFSGIAPRDSSDMFECGTAHRKCLSPILVFIVFDDDFENVAFQGVLLGIRIARGFRRSMK